MANVAVIIGRFSLFHHGHVQLIQHGLDNYDSVLVLIGSAHQSRSIKNPFSASERRGVIKKAFRGAAFDGELEFGFIRDYPYSDTQWGAEVTQKVYEHFSPYTDKITIVGSDRDASTYYLRSFPQWGLDLIDPVGDNLSATKFRTHMYEHIKTVDDVDGDEVFSSLPEETVEFLKWYVATEFFANQLEEYKFIQDYKKKISVFPYPVTINTADAVVIQSNHVLVVERNINPGKGLLALPGGHLDVGETLLECAIREAHEETGLKIVNGKKAEQITKDILRMSVKASKLFDHPERSLKARVITQAFLFSLDDTKALPSVTPQASEVKRVFWMPIGEALAHTEWMEDHWHILNWAVSQR